MVKPKPRLKRDRRRSKGITAKDIRRKLWEMQQDSQYFSPDIIPYIIQNRMMRWYNEQKAKLAS